MSVKLMFNLIRNQDFVFHFHATHSSWNNELIMRHRNIVDYHIFDINDNDEEVLNGSLNLNGISI